MINLDEKIEKYLGRKPNFIDGTEVTLQDDMVNGVSKAYIKFWSDSLEKPKPTDEQLSEIE